VFDQIILRRLQCESKRGIALPDGSSFYFVVSTGYSMVTPVTRQKALRRFLN
jgi:hypothetical protein